MPCIEPKALGLPRLRDEKPVSVTLGRQRPRQAWPLSPARPALHIANRNMHFCCKRQHTVSSERSFGTMCLLNIPGNLRVTGRGRWYFLVTIRPASVLTNEIDSITTMQVTSFSIDGIAEEKEHSSSISLHLFVCE